VPLTNIYVQHDRFKEVTAELIAEGKMTIEKGIQILYKAGIAVEVSEIEKLIKEYKHGLE
jgi:hypothetical protein